MTRKPSSSEPVTHYVYRGYLIRWSTWTIDKSENRVWIEHDSKFICWANDINGAKRTIDEVLS